MMDYLRHAPMFLVFMIPIVAMLTAHQRKMAKIMLDRDSRHHDGEGMRNEIMHLQQVVRFQAQAIEQLQNRQTEQERYNTNTEHSVCA